MSVTVKLIKFKQTQKNVVSPLASCSICRSLAIMKDILVNNEFNMGGKKNKGVFQENMAALKIIMCSQLHSSFPRYDYLDKPKMRITVANERMWMFRNGQLCKH